MMQENTGDERQFTFSEEEYNKLMEEQKAERMKSLRRHKVPAELSLKAALTALTKNELEDIQYNLNLPVAKNLARVKKDEMVAAIEPEVISFAGRWFVSAFDEQKDLFDYACKEGGLLKDLPAEDQRFDYLRGIGVMFCGLQDGKLVWFMPEEIQAEYQKLAQGAAFGEAVRLNTEVMRLAAGLVYYYGIMDYDQLFAKVKDYVEADLEFADFIGIIFNGGCWYHHIVAGQHELMHESLMNPEALVEAQKKQGNLEYAVFPYDKVYDAGQEGYVESTAAYRALAQYLMQKKNLDVLQAAEAVKSITIIMQNGYGMKEIVGFLADHNLRMSNMQETEELYGLIGRFNRNLPLWMLKGYTPSQLEQLPKRTVVREGQKIGRNDPCPCGSGKKYKNCCLDKTYH